MFQNLLIILLIALAFWLLKSLFPARHRPRLGQESGGHRLGPYQAVSIHSYSQHCAAAEALKGQRFLSSESPILPLEGCSCEDCHCVYTHHADRRSGNGGRRSARLAEEQLQQISGTRDRRRSNGRRQADPANVHALANLQS